MSEVRRAPTLKEIADRAGVHVSTVSRVLRQPEPALGWSDSARRIRQIAEDLGYTPNLWAASLRTRRTMTIGLVMTRLTDGVVARTYQGIEEAATGGGYSVLLSSPPDEPEAQRRAIGLLAGRQIDGLILGGLHAPAREFVRSLQLGRMPVLAVTRHGDSDLPFVGADDRQGGCLAGRHLLERGYDSLAVVSGPEHATTGRDRSAGFIDTVVEAGAVLPADRIVSTTFDTDGGVSAGRRLLGSADRPRAIFAASDTIAIGIMGVARDLGIRIPDDLALVGFNDIPIVAQLPRPLTTVRSPAQQIGNAAMRALVDLIDGREAETTRLPVELMVRATT